MRYLIFDLETAPIDDAGTYVEPASAPSNYKDPEKIAEYIKRAEAEAVSKCSLDPDLCRIVALGMYSDYDPTGGVFVCTDEQTERDVLERFWRFAHGTVLVGFNIVEFDLRVLLRRSLYLGVKAPKFKMGRYAYQRPDIIDLMLDLCWDDPRKAHSLSFYIQRFGLPSVQDDVTGADIGRLVQEGNWQAVENHCRADVLRTKALALRVGAIPAREEQVA